MTALAASPAQSPIRSDWQEPLAAAEEVETAPLELDPDYAISEAGAVIPMTAEMASSPAAPGARTIVFALTLSRRCCAHAFSL
jgi:hypothetical protein